MLVIAYVPFLFMLVGVLMYALAEKNTKVQEIGKMLFFAGVLAFALGSNGFGFHLGNPHER